MNLLRNRGLAAAMLGLLLATAPALAQAPSAPPAVVSPDQFATAWQQTSAEYKALCLQTYRSAYYSMEDLVRAGAFEYDGTRLVARSLVRNASGKLTWEQRPVAVVLDLDETVIDNSGYQAWLIQQNQKFSPESWSAWMRFQGQTPAAQRAVPGSAEFIKEIDDLGITAVYVTNRDESGRADTVKLLEAYGVPMEGIQERLMLQGDRKVDEETAKKLAAAFGAAPGSAQAQRLLANASDKEVRRVELQTKYHVVGWFGDNLYDFPVYVGSGNTTGAQMLDARDQSVVHNLRHWGSDWFVLPNPMYGSWNSSKTIPKGGMVDAMDDYGFQEFFKALAPK